jgi:integrase
MQELINHCRIGKFSVHPENWESPSAKVNIKWYITYWFYDDNLKQKKQVSFKGMNHLETLKEKQSYTRKLIKDELESLKEGYNPIAKSFQEETEITEYTGLLSALNYALKNAEMEHRTKVDVTNSFKYIIISIKELHFDRLAISDVKRKHIKLILEGCGKIKTYTNKKGETKNKKWGAYQFNRYRTYLSLLFKQLVQLDVIDVNPVREIEKKPQLKRIRETTTPKQRTELKEFTKKELYTFYRFIQIFYHSGSRITELLKVKKEDIYLYDQKFKIVVKKGKKFEEVLRTIKTIALPFWEQIYNEAEKGQYIFGLNLSPQFRDKPLSAEAPSKRWKRHMKDKLGITADLYSLKHSNLDEIAAYYSRTKEGIKEAQEAAGHSTPVITLRYLPGQEERNHRELKDVANEL